MASKSVPVGLTQSVERALALLTCFSDAQPRLRVSDLARQLELSQSTVSRLLATMESLGFVERDPQTGLYDLGLELVTLAGEMADTVSHRLGLVTIPSSAAIAWQPDARAQQPVSSPS